MADALETVRKICLQQALTETIHGLEIERLNEELSRTAPKAELRLLASQGLRGEFLFPVPSILRASPKLLGYYRLLLGFSQKEFYHKGGFGRFRSMEDGGVIRPAVDFEIEALCRALSLRSAELARGLGRTRLSLAFLDDLTLLTLGPQLRGSNNTKIGALATRALFESIRAQVRSAALRESPSEVVLHNTSGREVRILAASDPDIRIVEELAAGTLRKLLAIEVKGGADRSNVWNRLGEAEKSHLGARRDGFVECWTIYNTPELDISKARQKSPTTNRFFRLSCLLEPDSQESREFFGELLARIGL